MHCTIIIIQIINNFNTRKSWKINKVTDLLEMFLGNASVNTTITQQYGKRCFPCRSVSCRAVPTRAATVATQCWSKHVPRC
jgi:hypothetical protein